MMNPTPPDSPLPVPPSTASTPTLKPKLAPAEQDAPAVARQDVAGPPPRGGVVPPATDARTALPSKAAPAATGGVPSGVGDAEVSFASASSEDVEIYVSDMSGSLGEAFGGRPSDEQSSAEAPALSIHGRVNTTDTSNRSFAATTPSVQAPSTPLLTPNRRDTEATPLSTNTHTFTHLGAAAAAITSPPKNKTSTDNTTIDSAGPTANLTTPRTPTTTSFSSELAPPSTPPRRPLHLAPVVELRNQLLSPVGDVVDSPIIPLATRMSTIPLPDMDDHDDPTAMLPRSMEQMTIREAEEQQQAALRRSPQESQKGSMRGRGLTLGGGPPGLVSTPPPSSPLPGGGAPPLTAPPHMSSFPNTTFEPQPQQQQYRSGGGSGPTTPPMGIQPTTNYTQSQPLPQLPTFAPALSVINEGGGGRGMVSKDDLHLTPSNGDAYYRQDGGYGEEEGDMQANRAEGQQAAAIREPQRQGSSGNVTILPVYQQYGTITVSNSVVSFPNGSTTKSGTSPANGGSSSPTTTTNPTTPSASAPSSAGSAGTFAGQQKTPNVYINGLPPHFPEEQLEALAMPYGEVKSVRTFTRHVRDSESGYGFVLFETVEAAERCIIALRKYRNLHPTFSKQVHKIPGTVYAQANSQQGGESWDGNGGSEDGDASFKARMEALADPTSTNLYMEGLPLSMDEAALSALVSPHRVVSSRFFQTRLSNPPRIIAFVRLETRAGAEEVIERLHGKMVRGWNDAGSRISVRFADTSEQRELRRQERTLKEGSSNGEVTPGQLTIAQAALLNLRGQDLRTIGSPGALPSLPSVTSTLAGVPVPPVIGTTGRAATADWVASTVPGYDAVAVPGIGGAAAFGSASGREIIGSARELSINTALGGLGAQGLALGSAGLTNPAAGRMARLGNGASGVDYGAAFGGSAMGAIGSQRAAYQGMDGGGEGMRSLYHGDFGSAGPRDGTFGGMDPTMKALLESLGGGVGVDPSLQQQDLYRAQLDGVGSAAYGAYPGQRTGASVSQLLQYPQGYGGSGVASTTNGYTPAEEYIMRAHVENVARQNQGLGASGSVASSAAYLQQQQQQAAAAQRKRPSPLDLGRRGRQDEGVDIGVGVRGYRMQASLVGMSDEEAFHAQAREERAAAEAHQHQQQQQQQQVEEEREREAGGHQVHMRATTLPHQQGQDGRVPNQRRNSVIQGGASVGPVGGQRGAGRHYQTNSMSVASTTAMRTPQHGSVSTMGGPGDDKRMSVGDVKGYRASYGAQGGPVARTAQDVLYEDGGLSLSPASSGDSPSLISPALTYSSQHTPSTLSPATPFFGSFSSQSEGFRGVGVGVGVDGMGGKEQNNVGGVKGMKRLV